MDLTALAYLSYCFFSMFVMLECILFELVDYDLNRVILVGETNIVMTCSASEVSSPQYEIRHKGVIVDNQPFFRVTPTRTSVEVAITQVNNTHGGEYECLVTGGGMTIVSNLTLDVRDPFTEGGVYCPQSGETLTANEGDSLSLFCYFSWAADAGDFTSRDFVWQLINGSTLVSLDSTNVTRSPNFFKGLAEVLIGPLTTDDNLTEYQCYHPTEHRSGNRPCSVGPVIVITETVDISTVSLTSSTPTPKTSTFVIPNTAYVSTTTTHVSSTAPKISTIATSRTVSTTIIDALDTTIPTSQMASSNQAKSSPSITVNSSHFQTFVETPYLSTTKSPNAPILATISSTQTEPIMASETAMMTSRDSTIIVIISCVVAVIILVIFVVIIICLICSCRKREKHEHDQNEEVNLESTPPTHSDSPNGYLKLQPATESLTVGSNYQGMVSKPEPFDRTPNIERNLASNDMVSHNHLLFRPNEQERSERDDDEALTVIVEESDHSTLDGESDKSKQSSDREEDISDLAECRMGSVEQNLSTYKKVNHNPLFSRTNGRNQSGKKYDDVPVGIPEGLERSALYGKRENSDPEENFSDLYGKIDKTASLKRYSKKDKEDSILN